MSKKLKSMQLAISAFFALSVPLLISYLGSYYQELYAFVAIFFLHLPFTWDNIKGNRISTEPLVHYVNYYKPPKKGSIGGGDSSTGAGASTSTNSLDNDIAIIARNIQITRDLNEKSLFSNYGIKPSVLEAINQRFPVKDPRNVPESVTLYTSF